MSMGVIEYLGNISGLSGRKSEGEDSNMNFSKNLLELQMNWSETMFKLDNLLDLELPSFISLAHNNQQDEKKKAKFYTVPVDEILPEHAIKAIVNQ